MLTVLDPPIHHPSSTTITTNTASFIPPSSTALPRNDPLEPNDLSETPPTSHAPNLDDSMSSDDQSVSDPFHQDTYVSDGEMDRDMNVASATWDASQPSPMAHGDDRPQASARGTAPHIAPYSSQPASAAPTTQSIGQTGKASYQERLLGQENSKSAHSITTGSSIRSLTPHGGTRTADNSATDVFQSTARTEIPTHAMIGNRLSIVDTDARSLASRSGNREKIPPPPPKSHHGKLISPSPGSTPSVPSKPENCFPSHSSSPESSYSPKPSPKPSQSGVDYFTGPAGSEPEKPSESLRRSQSQYKRPPTPPLSRRHSQMRRSKTTLSKPNLSRLSMPAVKMEGTESPPPSPSSWTLNPSRTRGARLDVPSEEDPRRASLQYQSSGAAIPTPGTEASTSSSQSNSRTPSTKRASLGNPLPPPPPPRRTRGSSSHCNDRTRPQSEKRPEAHKEFIPHPSNANDILADLSRLQKEVDDLRVHYESRKASQ
ncbi:hypothetical protein BDV29DRAFT_80399 [Aspergillus leporis]|jgi:hypothetical protein|uniref:Uncharacterized protein n=1 Tax=Aspergillus leporis TaxID=41062 RepID=A0A5N5X7L3_9EURO|nr:hypothetical protein BDV29DRAFT_80399 [Aspergillus leporis]